MTPLTLLGGPLRLLAERLGLARGGTNPWRLALTPGALLWAVLAALALADGAVEELFSLSIVGVHVRLLLAIPLFLWCETWVDPRMAEFATSIARSGIVREQDLPRLESEIARTVRRKDSWLAEGLCLGAAVLMSMESSHLPLAGASAVFDPDRISGGGWAAPWYWIVCLPFLRFLMFRSLWRLALWTRFLWGVATLPLHLIPTHPDGVAGLGFLEVVHGHFAPLILAISALQAASLAEGLSTGATTLEAVYPALAFLMLWHGVLFLGPLFVFVPQLWACRVAGRREYMELAEGYVRNFEAKWLRGGAARGERLLGTADLQSLADLNNSVSVVRHMRIAPLSLSLVVSLAITASLPLLPLLLFEYPFRELLEKLVTTLVGL